MLRAITTFRENIRDINAITALHNHLTTAMGSAVNLDDLLRSKIVYSVSALDKLMHDTITTGMVEIFSGTRLATPKYLTEPIPTAVMQEIISASVVPPVVIYESAIRAKLKILSFQDPDKISDGLSYIWPESQKWQKIAAAAGEEASVMRTTLKLIVTRRNAIVHEGDIDPISNSKIPITATEAEDTVQFLIKVGETIHSLV